MTPLPCAPRKQAMFKGDYCAYPPQIASDVEVTEQRDGERLVYIVGSAAVGRYVLLHPTEHYVLQLLGESLAPTALCDEFRRKHGGRLSLAALHKFLARLDEIGVLAGERTQSRAGPGQQSGRQFYVRFKLFNPDRFFARMAPRLRWVWTPGFVVTTLLLMLLALLLCLRDWAEVTSYGAFVLREHYVAVFLAGTLVVFSHEFAHGLTCKAFGGRSTEVGVLMVFYFLPALYCNVSGLHLIPQVRRRLWVILAGVYWQLLVGTACAAHLVCGRASHTHLRACFPLFSRQRRERRLQCEPTHQTRWLLLSKPGPAPAQFNGPLAGLLAWVVAARCYRRTRPSSGAV